MIVRYLTQDDITQHDKVSSQAFCYPCEIGNPDSVLPAEKMIGAFDDDGKTLFADLEILEKKCYYDGSLLTCAAIGGVAAKPEHRGKGAVKALFEYLFRETDYDISILYPFSEEYYRRFGYERTGLSLNVSLPFAEISKAKRNSDVTLYEGGDAQRLLSVYNKCAREYNLCFARDSAAAFSSDPYFTQKSTYVWKDGALATVRVDRKKSTVFVSDFYYDSYESMLGFLGFLRGFESNHSTLCFEKLPENTPLIGVVNELKNCDVKVHSNGAARILNAEKVLKLHRYPAGEGGFSIRIGGETFCVTVSDGVAEVERNPAPEPDITMDIRAASAVLLCGAADAAHFPGVKVNNPQSDFFGMFPPKITFFTDEF